MIINIENDNLKEVLETNNKKVVLDFWAPWCGPCLAISPVLEEVVTKNPEITVVKVNVDNYQELAVEYGVRSIPALFFLNNGEVKDKHVGTMTVEEILAKVESI